MRTLLFLVTPAIAGAATPTASSVGTSTDGVVHPATLAFDGLLSTSWAEGAIGDGAGEWIEVRFDRPVDISSVSVWPGWMGGVNRDLRLHGRPRNITLTFDVVRGADVVEQDVILDPGEAQRPLRHDVRVNVPGARSMRLTMDQVYGGGIYSDTYITEIALNLVAGEPVAQVAQVRAWMDSDAGQRADTAQRDRVIGLFDAISGAEFGDRDKLQLLMDWAADGAPYLRERVAARVPWGFRLDALLPDKNAVEALLKLKDANAVTAMERAALRTTGTVSDELSRRARMLDAYARILGGGRRNIDPWGEEGFEKGALRSFGEPLPLAADEYGGLYVADLANHRLQRFSMDTGIQEQSWGHPAAGLTDFWFRGRREPYPAGAEPSLTAPGFILPVDVAVRPGRLGDTVYVLDYGREPDHKGPFGRVTEILPDGTWGHQQELPFATPISPRAGGEGHLIVDKQHVIVIWANQGISYSLPGWEEGERFDLEDGSPTGAIGLPGHKLGLIYGTDLVMYSLDGFRHGSVLGPSVLGDGYEDWNLAADERGKWWAVLDTGEVVKFKRLGKVDYRFRLVNNALPNPRIDVFDDLVFVSSGDRIIKGDALELYEQQNSEEPSGSSLDVGLGGRK